MLIASVLGIGVAVSVKTSTSARRFFNASFCRTPKRCSSSMMTRPRFGNLTSCDKSLCVPITISIWPFASASMVCLTSLVLRKRDNSAIRTGKSAKRSLKVWKCCSANKVVGARIATCRESDTAIKAARKATSVFPKPTSPHTSLSIGFWAIMSCTTA